MDLSYYKSLEPFWGTWYISKSIGEGAYGKVFEIVRRDYGTFTSALKIITIPQSEGEWQSLLADGMDEASTVEYYKDFVNEIISEISLLSGLKGHSNIVSYEDHSVIEHSDGKGWDILIRMELLTPFLNTIPKDRSLDRDKVIKLGIDICNALEFCQTQKIIHRDIKPENIFVSRLGDYKLGDFGIARTVEKTTGVLSKKGTYTYMAPEVYKEEPYDLTVDIYSLGIVLYRLVNRNRAPFLPQYPIPLRHSDREEAMGRRFKGENIPLPVDAQDELGEIILKACAYKKEDRYQTPAEMRRALEQVKLLNETAINSSEILINETTLQKIEDDIEKNDVFEKKGDAEKELNVKDEIACVGAQSTIDTAGTGKNKKKRMFMGLVLGVFMIASIAIGILLINNYKKDAGNDSDSDSTLATQRQTVSDQNNDSTLVTQNQTIPDQNHDLTDSGISSSTQANLTMWFLDYGWYNDAFDEMMKKYPKISLTLETFENEAYKKKIKAAIATDELPDIFFTWGGSEYLGDFVNQDKVYCLDDVLEKYINNGELPEAMTNSSTFNGKHYGVPTIMSVVCLFANMDLLNSVGWYEIPTTYDELIECCDRLVAAGIVPFGCSGETWCITEYLEPIIEKTIGAKELNDIFIGRASFNNDGVARAVDIFQNMMYKGYFDSEDAHNWSDRVKEKFMKGEYAFFQNGSWNCGDIATSGLNVDVAEFPVIDSKKSSLGQMIGGSSDLLVVAKSSKNANVASEYAVELGRLISLSGYNNGVYISSWKTNGDTSEPNPLIKIINAKCHLAKSFVLWGDTAMSPSERDIYLDFVDKIYNNSIDGQGFINKLSKELR